MKKLSNIELFNGITGKIFAVLYQNFPNETEIESSGFLSDFIDPEDFEGGWEISEITGSTVKWLDRAGYIWLTETQCLDGGYTATLSPKGLEVLKAIPDSLEPTESIGDKLVRYSKKRFSDGMNQIVKAAISEGIKFVD